MEFRVLGALEVEEGGRRLALGPGKQRAVLAALLLHANEVVPLDRLIDELWGDAPPESARKALQVYVSRLRGVLGGARIRTHGSGYVLEVGPDELDLDRFERLLEEGRELRARGESAAASAALREALALWHGSPLADLSDEPFAQREIGRLEELRLTALEQRVDSDLALGRGSELVGELEALVAKQPYRERLRGQLMLALYRAGRQADALALYQETRRLFVDELGLEPSASLQRLEGAILRREAELDALPEPVALPAGGERAVDAEAQRAVASPPKRTRLPAVVVAGAALVAASVALGIVRARDSDFLSHVDAHAIGVIDSEQTAISAQLMIRGRPSLITAGDQEIWVASEEEGTVSRVEPGLRNVQGLSLGARLGGVAYGAGSLWATKSDERTLVQIDPRTLRVVQSFPVGNSPGAVAIGAGAAWVVNRLDGTVSRIALESGSVMDPIPVGLNPVAIAVQRGSVWVVVEGDGRVVRIDPASGAIVPVHTGNGPTAIAAREDIWIANTDDGTVSRIDPARDSVAETLTVGAEPSAVVVHGNFVWVANRGDGTVTRIDASTGRRTELSLGSNPNALAIADGKIWVTTLPAPVGHRGGVLRVESRPSACGCADPARWAEVGNPTDAAVPTLLYDGLVAYRRRGGTAGRKLVPDLARRIPMPTDGGRSYGFQLRPGIRYSDGSSVRASDFRASLERALLMNPLAASLYDKIVGAAGCTTARTTRCNLSRGIHVDDSAGTITIRLTEPDPDLIHKLAHMTASIVPAKTPLRTNGRQVRGTGPYTVARLDPRRRIRLVRNGHFRLWSADARPDGYPDEIDFRLSDDANARLAAVENGTGDWVSLVDESLSAERQRGVLTRFASRLHTDPAPWTFWIFLNTRIRPFDDLRVRHALSYAIDRQALVDATGGLARTTCQILPPNLPAYSPYCPYTRKPNPAGTWTGADLSKARELVAASGTAGMRVTVVTHRDDAPLGVARSVASTLRRLGYRASLRPLPSFPEFLAYVNDSRNHVQLGPIGWAADTLKPSTFLRSPFACASYLPNSPLNSNVSRFCDRELDSRIKEAAALQSSDPARADELWAEVDRLLVDRAPAVPWGTPDNRVLVSERVGNYQSHPLWGTLLDQLWVR